MVTWDMFLPDEVIFEILSWLPIKSLLRFKCVCKIWRSTIEDPMFIDKHMKQAQLEMVYQEDEGTEFYGFLTIQGITLETHNSNNTCRLRNHATREVLNLPAATERTGTCTSLCYIRPTNELKVIYIDSSNKGDEEVLIYNILRVGTHFTWKRLESSLLLGNLINDVWRSNRVIGSVFYNIRVADNIFIDCVDLENESITSTKVPPHLFCKWTGVEVEVWSVNWQEKLSLACVEQDRLIIDVLEDHKNHKWSERSIVIPLRFFIDSISPSISMENLTPYTVRGNVVYWRNEEEDYQLFSFDTRSKKLKCLTPLSTQRKLAFAYEPSLLPLHFKVENLQCQIEETQGSLLLRFMRLSKLCLLGA